MEMTKEDELELENLMSQKKNNLGQGFKRKLQSSLMLGLQDTAQR